MRRLLGQEPNYLRNGNSRANGPGRRRDMPAHVVALQPNDQADLAFSLDARDELHAGYDVVGLLRRGEEGAGYGPGGVNDDVEGGCCRSCGPERRCRRSGRRAGRLF